MELKPGMDWPPKQWAPALDTVAHDRAWLIGDLKRLPKSDTAGSSPVSHRTQFNGGLVGATSRAILGKPNPDSSGRAMIQRHLPVAAELAETVGDLLFGNTPTITPPEGADTRLEEAIKAYTENPIFAARLVEAGQSCSATGWKFWRVRWDAEVSSQPWIEWLPADKGFASYAGERLTELTFVDEYRLDDTSRTVYRMTETHRPGTIEYILWKGTQTQLGMTVPFEELEQTSYLADLLTEHPTVLETGVDVMTAGQVINRATNPAWESHPHLNMYGKSDIQFGGGIWRDIDQGYQEMWHEVDSARARLLVPEVYMDSLDPGRGTVFDWMRDVFPLGQSGNADQVQAIERVQFDMRVDSYLQVIQYATIQAVGHFGLSPMTFGMDQQASGDMTATEIERRERRTVNSWRSRTRYWRAGLSEAVTAWAQVYCVLNSLSPLSEPVNVSMVEPIQDTDQDRARTANEWKVAESASIRTRVRHLHPEWEDAEVDKEVQALKEELGIGQQAHNPFMLEPDQPIE